MSKITGQIIDFIVPESNLIYVACRLHDNDKPTGDFCCFRATLHDIEDEDTQNWVIKQFEQRVNTPEQFAKVLKQYYEKNFEHNEKVLSVLNEVLALHGNCDENTIQPPPTPSNLEGNKLQPETSNQTTIHQEES